MKRSMLLIVISIVFVFAIIISGCSKSSKEGQPATNSQPPANSETTSPSPGTDAGAPEDYTLPIVTPGSVTLTYAMADNLLETSSYSTGLPVEKELEKRTGIHIDYVVAGSESYDDIMNVKLAAGVGLPDIFMLPEETTPIQYATDKLIIPLNDLIEKYVRISVNISRIVPEVYAQMKASDGQVYALPNIVSAYAYTDPYSLFIRQDWLDELKLQRPTTLDEWYTTLKAFQDNDMNKNNKKDEVFLPNFKMEGLLYLAGSGYDMHQFMSDGFFPDKDGKVIYEYINPRMKEMMTWLRKLYAEGLINPTFLTDTKADIKSKVAKNLGGGSNRSLGNAAGYDTIQQGAGLSTVNWAMAVPPHIDGYKGTFYLYGPFDGWHAISKDAKNPEAAIKFLDYIWASEEGNRLLSFGVEGVLYDMVNGQPEFNDYAKSKPDGKDVNTLLLEQGATPRMAWMTDNVGPSARLTQLFAEQDPPKIQQYAKEAEPYLTSFSVFGMPSNEESKIITTTMTDIETYRDETLANWVTGKEAIDFDKYVSTIQSMGIDKVIKVKQDMHNRYLGK